MASIFTNPRPMTPAQPSTEPPPAAPDTITQLQREAAVSNNPRVRDQFEREQVEQIRRRAAPSTQATPLGGRAAVPPQSPSGRAAAVLPAAVPRPTQSLTATDSLPTADPPVRGAVMAAQLPQGLDHARQAATQQASAGVPPGAARQSGTQTATRPGR